jgi:hypothetical protein
MRLWIVVGVIVLGVLAWASTTSGVLTGKRANAARGCHRATPGSLARVVSSAHAGDKICLAAGDYGTFRGAAKRGTVTLSGDRRRSARMTLELSGARGLVLEHLRIRGGTLTGDTRNILIRDSTFSAPTTIDGLAGANVRFDRDTFNNMNVPSLHATPARIHLAYGSGTASGVTISRSLFAGGDADGIQTGVGVRIVDNEFRDILGHGGPNHTDAIQLLGAPHAVVRGNYIHHSDSGIVAYDGLAAATIEDNVVDLTEPGSMRPWGIEVYSDNGSTVRHNTLKYGRCKYRLPCGLIDINRKQGDPAGQGTTVTDNVATQISLQNGSALARRGGNLVRIDAEDGDRRGVPKFAGGRDPDDYRGFLLAPGSPGRRSASDSSNPGISR